MAAVQFESQPDDKEANFEIIERFVAQAARRGVELIVFPECCLTGYWFIRNLPASTGAFDGDQRITAIHRRQWASVSQPYTTYSLSYDRLLAAPSESGSHHNAGLIINSDVSKKAVRRQLIFLNEFIKVR